MFSPESGDEVSRSDWNACAIGWFTVCGALSAVLPATAQGVPPEAVEDARVLMGHAPWCPCLPAVVDCYRPDPSRDTLRDRCPGASDGPLGPAATRTRASNRTDRGALSSSAARRSAGCRSAVSCSTRAGSGTSSTWGACVATRPCPSTLTSGQHDAENGTGDHAFTRSVRPSRRASAPHDQLGGVAERGVQQPTDAAPKVVGQRLGSATDRSRQRQQRHGRGAENQQVPVWGPDVQEYRHGATGQHQDAKPTGHLPIMAPRQHAKVDAYVSCAPRPAQRNTRPTPKYVRQRPSNPYVPAITTGPISVSRMTPTLVCVRQPTFDQSSKASPFSSHPPA